MVPRRTEANEWRFPMPVHGVRVKHSVEVEIEDIVHGR
jgi:hypothetical protein